MIYRYVGGGYLAQRELTVYLGLKETVPLDFHLKFVMGSVFLKSASEYVPIRNTVVVTYNQSVPSSLQDLYVCLQY
jgi:hypothetical protein